MRTIRASPWLACGNRSPSRSNRWIYRPKRFAYERALFVRRVKTKKSFVFFIFFFFSWFFVLLLQFPGTPTGIDSVYRHFIAPRWKWGSNELRKIFRPRSHLSEAADRNYVTPRSVLDMHRFFSLSFCLLCRRHARIIWNKEMNGRREIVTIASVGQSRIFVL